MQTFTDILGSAVNSKISEISSALSQLNPNSTEYALLTSVIDMLGDIASLVQTSGGRVKRDSSKITAGMNVLNDVTLLDCRL